jgi:D-inositol-3-phosphate glycosyltransferase
MISFVWPDIMTFTPWAGGSEVYTMNHIRELQRRGIPTRIITCSEENAASVANYPDVPLLALENTAELETLDDTLIFVLHPMRVKTKHQSYVILHNTVKGPQHDDTEIYTNNGLGDIQPIATSKYMARYFKDVLHLPDEPPVIYPSADRVFSEVDRQKSSSKPAKILFAGRPTQEKGVYILLASLYMQPILKEQFIVDCVATMNNNDTGEADAIIALFKAHPRIATISPGKDREEMAKIYAAHDIVVMPTSSLMWKEAFGMISIEAQHAGCRVVASNDGGLPETDCGELILVEPDNPLALAEGIAKAINLGPLTTEQRKNAASKFTDARSLDSLLNLVGTFLK